MVELTFEEYSKRRNAEIIQMIDNDLMKGKDV